MNKTKEFFGWVLFGSGLYVWLSIQLFILAVYYAHKYLVKIAKRIDRARGVIDDD